MRFFTIILLFSTFFYSLSAHALGKLGHQLVCELAYQQLNNKHKIALNQLLELLPQNEVQQLNKYNYANLKSNISYAKACTWPDAVKNDDKFNQFKSWHYVNVSRNKNSLSENTCHENCITQAIKYHQKQFLQTKEALKKLQALMFIGHWLGDIHQPLHVSFASDLGGNKTQVSGKNIKCSSMHWLWDECLLTYQSSFKKLNEQFKELLPSISIIKQTQITQWQKSKIIDWANESLAIATAATTQYCVHKDGNCQTVRQQPIIITDDYLQKNSEILNIRIQQASVRLAKILTELL